MASILPTASRSAFKRSIAHTSAPMLRVAFYSSTMHDNDPEVLEREKGRNLSKQQHKTSTPIPEAPGWNETLASASEAAVKADKHEHYSPQEMQRRTVQYIKSRHHDAPDTILFTESPPVEPGVSTQKMKHNGSSDGEASYSHDEVDGPLKTAHGEATVEKIEHHDDVITRKRVM